MYTQEQINQIRAKSGLPPLLGKENTSGSTATVGKYDYLLQNKPSTQLDTRAEFMKETAQDVEQTTNAIKGTIAQTQDKISNIAEASISGGENKLTAFLKTAGIIAGGISQGLGDLFTGAVKYVLPKKSEDYIKEKIKNTIENGSISDSKWAKEFGSAFSTFKENYNNLPDKDKRTVDALLGGSRLAFDLGTAGTTKKITELGLERSANIAGETLAMTGGAIKDTAQSLKQGLGDVGTNISENGVFKGAKQFGTEIIERVPRAIDRLKESSAKAAERAVKIAQSEPAVAEAFKTNLDSRFINAVVEANPETRKAFKQVIDIAEETPKSLALKTQPSKVSGELAVKQFDMINKERQRVGRQIGENIKNLSKNVKIDVSDSLNQMDKILSENGIQVLSDGKKIRLDFSGSKFTPNERTRIQELYNLATEGGKGITPNQIHTKDQLFSKLQREARMDGIGNLFVTTNDGEKSIFRVFRDIYSANLEKIDPEFSILNKEYQKLSSITDDIEDTILKTPNLNVIKNADQAEFAKVNLRRIFGEANSSPAFEKVAQEMDDLARTLGYSEANPKDIAEFAQAIRELYPETIPKTGFTGGVSLGLKDIASKVLSAGTPNAEDKRKALKKLLEHYTK